MTILGIETSCDETSAAVIRIDEASKKLTLLSNITTSSLSFHAKTGGIIPEIAAREQIKYILPVIQESLRSTPGVDAQTIDAIAVTFGPGLIGSLLVGVETARTLSYLWDKPLIPVNHLHGHIYANFIREISNVKYQMSNNPMPEFPAIALVVSGGHTDLVLMKSHSKFQVIGNTRDDAAGEAFDKIGRLLGLSYPAGPIIALLAEKGNPKAYRFPRPMHDSGDFDFSFSGLKTAAVNLIKKNGWDFSSSGGQLSWPKSRSQTDDSSRQVKDPERARTINSQTQLLSDLCASVQQAIIDILVQKTLNAAKKYEVKSILLGGGVAANEMLRNQMQLGAKRYVLDAKLFAPVKNLCSDNAAMIAAAAYFQQSKVHWQDVTADPELYY